MFDKLRCAALASLEQSARNPPYKFYKFNVCDVAPSKDVFEREPPDAILHLAAESHESYKVGIR